MSTSVSKLAVTALVLSIVFAKTVRADGPMSELELRKRDVCQRARLMLEIHYEEEASEARSYGTGMQTRMNITHRTILDEFTTQLASSPDVLSKMSRYLNDIRELRSTDSGSGRIRTTEIEHPVISATAPTTLASVNRVIGQVNSRSEIFSRQPIRSDVTELRPRGGGESIFAVATIPEQLRSGDNQADFVRDRIYAEVGEDEIRIRACTQARRNVGTTLFDGCTTDTYAVDEYGNIQTSRSSLQYGLFEVRGFSFPIPEKQEYIRSNEDYSCQELLSRPTGLAAAAGELDRSPAVDTQSDGSTVPNVLDQTPRRGPSFISGQAAN